MFFLENNIVPVLYIGKTYSIVQTTSPPNISEDLFTGTMCKVEILEDCTAEIVPVWNCSDMEVRLRELANAPSHK